MNRARRVLIGPSRLLLCAAGGTAGAVAFGVLFAVMFQLVAYGSVIFYLVIAAAFAGAIGGPVFGVAYYVAIDRRRRSASRTVSALLAGLLAAVIFAVMGGGFHGWSEWEGAQAPTKTPTHPMTSSRPAAGRTGSITMRATPDGGEIIEQHAPAKDDHFGQRILATAGTLAIAGFLYGTLFGAVFSRLFSSQEKAT